MANVNTLPALTDYSETGWLAYVGKSVGTPNRTIALEYLVNTETEQTITALKTFDKDMAAMKGTSTGITTISTDNTGASNYVATFPAVTGRIAVEGMTDDFEFGGQAHGGSATVAFSASKTFDAVDGNNQKMVVTATTEVAITNELPGVYTFKLLIDSGASPVITVGASFGTVMDNSADIIDGDGDVVLITLHVDPDSDNSYTINTITA